MEQRFDVDLSGLRRSLATVEHVLMRFHPIPVDEGTAVQGSVGFLYLHPPAVIHRDHHQGPSQGQAGRPPRGDWSC